MDDPVAETFVGGGTPVVGFVGVQDVALAGAAISLLAAVTEGLNARQRDSDAIGVVTVRREGLAQEMRLNALDPLGAGPHPDAARPAPARARLAVAQPFKTPFAVLR